MPVEEAPPETQEPTLPTPPAMPTLLAAPPPMIPPVAGQKASHFAGPLVSGAPGFVQGQATLAVRFDVSYLSGAFTGATPGAKLTFPPGTMLGRIRTDVRTAFTVAATALKIGTTATGAEIASILLDAVATLETVPLIMIPANGIIYLTLNPGASTAGAASVAIGYVGAPAAKWS